MILTYEMIVRKQPCKKQLNQFRELFGDGGEVTLEACRKAGEAELHIWWAAAMFLGPSALAYFENLRWTALQEYHVLAGYTGHRNEAGVKRCMDKIAVAFYEASLL